MTHRQSLGSEWLTNQRGEQSVAKLSNIDARTVNSQVCPSLSVCLCPSLPVSHSVCLSLSLSLSLCLSLLVCLSRSQVAAQRLARAVVCPTGHPPPHTRLTRCSNRLPIPIQSDHPPPRSRHRVPLPKSPLFRQHAQPQHSLSPRRWWGGYAQPQHSLSLSPRRWWGRETSVCACMCHQVTAFRETMGEVQGQQSRLHFQMDAVRRQVILSLPPFLSLSLSLSLSLFHSFSLSLQMDAVRRQVSSHVLTHAGFFACTHARRHMLVYCRWSLLPSPPPFSPPSLTHSPREGGRGPKRGKRVDRRHKGGKWPFKLPREAGG